MVISVKKLSLYVAVADLIAEVLVLGKPVVSGQLDKQEILTQLPFAEFASQCRSTGKPIA